jgi:hypothetical protein
VSLNQTRILSVTLKNDANTNITLHPSVLAATDGGVVPFQLGTGSPGQGPFSGPVRPSQSRCNLLPPALLSSRGSWTSPPTIRSARS